MLTRQQTFVAAKHDEAVSLTSEGVQGVLTVESGDTRIVIYLSERQVHKLHNEAVGETYEIARRTLIDAFNATVIDEAGFDEAEVDV